MRIGNGGLNLHRIQRAGFVSVTGNCCPRRNVRFPAKCMASSSSSSSSSSLEFNHYAILGVTPFASKSDVKTAYKRLALKYHPDVIRGDHVADKQEKFQQIKSAYESLMQKFEGEEQPQANYDESDEWEEWMGFEGGIPFQAKTYQSYNY